MEFSEPTGSRPVQRTGIINSHALLGGPHHHYVRVYVFGTHRRALLQDVELMPQHQDFGFKPSSRLETVAQHADEKEGNNEHPAIMF